eukprot:1676864-Amphidinium_carterae.1
MCFLQCFAKAIVWAGRHSRKKTFVNSHLTHALRIEYCLTVQLVSRFLLRTSSVFGPRGRALPEDNKLPESR